MSCISFVQKEEGFCSSFGSVQKEKHREQFKHRPPRCSRLGCRRQAAFVTSPRLLFACPGAGAVDSHLASAGALLGGERVSLSVAGHSGTVGALDGGRDAV